MAAVHEVLRYLLERVPHSTQDEHDRVAGLIDQDEHPEHPSEAGMLHAGEDTDEHTEEEDR